MSINDKIEQLEKAFENLKIIIEAYEKEKDKIIKDNIENIKIYVRGHNLFDIFYGRYHGTAEQEILQQYIDIAPRDTFKDIFDAIDAFVYFENRRK